MPTATRSVAVDRLTKASVVDTHVGSLRPVTDENRGCITKLFDSSVFTDLPDSSSTALSII